jgi:phage tail protein X
MDDTEKLVQMMGRCGLATGHGDTIDDLIFELEKQIKNISNAFSDARKQIARSRKVLQQITELTPFKSNTGYASLQYVTQMLVEMTALAHEALKEKE